MTVTDAGTLALRIACIMMVAMVIDAAICAVIGQWTLGAFITGLEYAGFVALLVGGAAVRGASRGLQSSARFRDPDERLRSVRRSKNELLGAYGHCILFCSAGFLLWILAAIITP